MFFEKGIGVFRPFAVLGVNQPLKQKKEDEKIRVNDDCGLLLGDSKGARGLERDA